MLNLDETFEINNSYVIQRDLYLRGFLYSSGVIIFIELVRAQVAEVDLLQLIPGFYLIVLFISFLVLLYISDFLLRIPVESDNDKVFGTKTIERAETGISLKLSYFLFYCCLGSSLNSVIPLSLDSFNSYGEKTLENIWSFDEVISLEIILLTILLLLCQIPVIFLVSLNNEKEISILPEYWKTLSFIVFIASGILTPTIDGYTQLSFAFSAHSLYLIIIIILTKRLDIKFSTFKSLSF
jgi:hypothetical protein